MASDPDIVESKIAADMADPSLARSLDAVPVASEGSLTQLVGPTTPEDGRPTTSEDGRPTTSEDGIPTTSEDGGPTSPEDGGPTSPEDGSNIHLDVVNPSVKTINNPPLEDQIDIDLPGDDTITADISSSRHPMTISPMRIPRGFVSARSERTGCCGVNWCDWFPKMCCVDSGRTGSSGPPGGRGSYERLGSAAYSFDMNLLNSPGEQEIDKTKQEELCFYNDNDTFQTVVIEKNLLTKDLCQFLTVKNRVAKDLSWTIVESWPELGLERYLEDHEEVLSVHKEMESCASQSERRFIFRKEFRKYEFFHAPRQFFPPEMVDFESGEFSGPFTERYAVLENMLGKGAKNPTVFSSAWIRDPEKNVWTKIGMVVRGKKLYFTTKGFRYSSKRPTKIKTEQLEVLAHLSDYYVYSSLDSKKQFNAPTEWGICLRPSSRAEAEETAGGELKCITFEDENIRNCWIIAMRLAKYGKQLRDNYRAFKNKQCESAGSPKEYDRYTVPNESVRSRVAMDFTGSVGRIVEDPKEAQAIALSEGTSWRRRWKPATRRPPPPGHSLAGARGLDSGVHITQPWFHSGMTRDHAASLVIKHGTVNGVFLVRESRSNTGAFVLTYKSGGKVLHTQIQPIMDHVRQAYCYSLDSGVTKFYDLLQLVEFYQLNAGCLPTRLTHYVVQSPTGPVLHQETSTLPSTLPAARQLPSTSSAAGQLPSTSSAGGQLPSTSSAGGQLPSTSSAGGQLPSTSSAEGQLPSTSSAGGQLPATSSAGGQLPPSTPTSSSPAITPAEPSNI